MVMRPVVAVPTVEGMPLRRPPEPVSDRVWSRLRPRAVAGADEPSPPRRQAEVGVADARDEPPEGRGEPAGWVPDRESIPGSSRRRPPGARRRVRVEVPERLRTGEWLPSKAAAIGLLAVVVVAALIFALRWGWASSRDAPALIRAAATPSTSAGGGTSASARAAPLGSASPGAPGDGMVVVDVAGQVMHPGVFRLPAGSRVDDALTAAGGVTPEADVGALNRARLLVDGEQVRVPRPGEVVTTGSAGGGAGGATAAGGHPLVSLNNADLSALDGLPGVGPVLAQRILDWRAAHGRFTSVDELGEVSGIGGKLLSQLKPLVTL